MATDPQTQSKDASQAHSEFVVQRQAALRLQRPDTAESFDLERLSNIHRELHSGVSSTAGALRDVNMATKDGDQRLAYTRVENIERYAKAISDEIRASNNFRDLPKDQWAEKVGQTVTDLSTLRPFRDGNDVTTKTFVAELAKEGGYQVDFSKVSQEQWERASKDSIRGNAQSVTKIISDIAVPERAIAFDKLPKEAALAKHPELEQAYKEVEKVRPIETNTLRQAPELTTTKEQTGAAKPPGQSAPTVGQDEKDRVYSEVLTRVRNQLAAGEIPKGEETIQQSRAAIEQAAETRQLTLREPDRVQGRAEGVVVAQSQHHVLVKLGETVAVPYEKTNLRQDVNTGEAVRIQYGKEASHVERNPSPDREQETALARDRSRDLSR